MSPEVEAPSGSLNNHNHVARDDLKTNVHCKFRYAIIATLVTIKHLLALLPSFVGWKID